MVWHCTYHLHITETCLPASDHLSYVQILTEARYLFHPSCLKPWHGPASQTANQSVTDVTYP